MNILHATTDPPLIDRLHQMLSSSERADIAVGLLLHERLPGRGRPIGPPAEGAHPRRPHRPPRVRGSCVLACSKPRHCSRSLPPTPQSAAAKERGWRSRPSTTSPRVYRSCLKPTNTKEAVAGLREMIAAGRVEVRDLPAKPPPRQGLPLLVPAGTRRTGGRGRRVLQLHPRRVHRQHRAKCTRDRRCRDGRIAPLVR